MLPKPGDHALVAQRGLQRGLLAGAGFRQHRGVELVAERLRPQPAQQRLGIELGALNQLHRAEAARIVEGHRGAVRHVKHHMVVRGALGVLVIIDARLGVRADAERARHAEMHHQHLARRQIGQQIFRPPAEALDRLPGQALFEVLGNRPAQAAVAHLDLGQARAFHGGRQAAPHGLDFGELGHG